MELKLNPGETVIMDHTIKRMPGMKAHLFNEFIKTSHLSYRMRYM